MPTVTFNFPTKYAEFERDYKEQRRQQRARRKEQRIASTETKRLSTPGLIRLPPDIDARGVGNCGIVASAIAARIPYQDAFNFYKYQSSHALKSPKTRGSKWEGSIYVLGRTNELTELFNHFNVQYESVSLPYTMDVRHFARRFAEQGVTYVIATRNHLAIIRSGYFIDQIGAVPLDVRTRHMGSDLKQVYKIL